MQLLQISLHSKIDKLINLIGEKRLLISFIVEVKDYIIKLYCILVQIHLSLVNMINTGKSVVNYSDYIMLIILHMVEPFAVILIHLKCINFVQ